MFNKNTMTNLIKRNNVPENWCENNFSNNTNEIVFFTKWVLDLIEILKIFDDKNNDLIIDKVKANKLIESIRGEINNKTFIEKYDIIIWNLKIGDYFNWIKIDWLLFNFIKVFQKTLDYKDKDKSNIKLDLLKRYLETEINKEEIFNYKKN